jgi:hypothetical protein
MNMMIGFGLASTSSITWRSAFLELALHAGTRLHQPDVERTQRHVLQHRRHVAIDDAARETLGHRGLADAGLADQHRVVLAAAQQDIDQLAHFIVAPDDLVDLAVARLLGEIDREFGKRAAIAGRPGIGGATVAGAQCGTPCIDDILFGRMDGYRREIAAELVGIDLPELARNCIKRVLELRRLEHAVDEMPGTDLARAELQRSIEPALLDRLLDLRREIGNRCRAARQRVECGEDVARQFRIVDPEGRTDRGNVVRAILQQDMDPVDELDIRIAAHLAEAGGRFDGFQRRRTKTPEQG